MASRISPHATMIGMARGPMPYTGAGSAMASHRITSAIASSVAAIASAARSIFGFVGHLPYAAYPPRRGGSTCGHAGIEVPPQRRSEEKRYDFTNPTSLSTLRTRTCSSLRNLAKASPGT